ncbi:cob(I)yrinic acid a,c-diamide adenosyltransferase [Thermodesulfitimonas autotrophica]|uniref:cob(I)yrinic acid a,c-diamide adenosyltransferase n=1 Tax=Thermodesulfitimonas autotrophica TaxID=1894989 RepID=UPI002FE351FA
MAQGLVMVFTGDGKGKTTAALGMALRAWGHGMRVFIVQFVKSDRVMTGERLAAAQLGERFVIQTLGEGFVFPAADRDRHREAAARALAAAREALTGGYDMVVLDEITHALRHGLVSEEAVLMLIDAKPPAVHLVLTGRDAPPALVERADLVTEMRAVKHHYARGVPAQKGVEY